MTDHYHQVPPPPFTSRHGSPEEYFVLNFEGCMTSVWVFLDDNGLFFELPPTES
jgi:hypothetical protein